MPEIPRTKFNSPWTVANIEAALNDVSSAKGSSESLTAALNAMRAEINSLSGGVHLKGAVDYYADLPASPSEGDAYTVRYQGTSGTDPLGIEYAWATYQGTPQWIPVGVDPSVFAKQTEMDVVANSGAKNLLNVKLAENYRTGQEGSFPITTGNVTFSENGGIITTSGTASATTTLRAPIYLPIGTYYISGSPASGSDTTYRTDLREQGTNVMISSNRDYGSGFEVEITTGRTVDWCIRIQSGFNATGLTFSPMIRPAAITDPTFQPYSKTNTELTVLTDEDRAALFEIVDSGAKNLSQFNSGTAAADNVTLATGIPLVGHAGEVLVFSYETTLSSGIITVGLKDANGNATGSVEIGNTIKKKIVTIPEGTAKFNVFVSKAGTYTNFMICTETAWKISTQYQPYRPSWQEMYDMILALQSGGNRALTMQTEPEESEER